MSTPQRAAPGAPRGRATATQAAAPAAANPFLKRGADAIAGAEAEKARQDQKAEQRRAGVGNVFRFGVRKCETRELIILDHSLEDGCALHEHQYEQNGSWNHFEQCIREATACPICEKLGREGYYANYLTVLDLTGYTRKNSQEFVPQFRCLLRIKGTSRDKFKQLQVIAQQQGKSLRGMFLRMHRPEGNDNSTNIGEPMMLEECGGALFYIYGEDELIANYGHDAILGRDGKTIVKQQDQDILPFPYEVVFPAPDIADVIKRWGGSNLHQQAAAELQDAPQAAPAAGGPARRQLPATAAPAPAPARPAPTRAAPAQAGPAPARAQAAPAQAAPAGRARATAAPQAPAGRAAPTRAQAGPARTAPVQQAAAQDLDDPDAGDGAGAGYEEEDPLA